MKTLLIVLLLTCLAGCSVPKRPVIDSGLPIDNRDRWKALAPLIKKHFKTDWSVKEIAAELNYQEYLKNAPTEVEYKKYLPEEWE